MENSNLRETSLSSANASQICSHLKSSLTQNQTLWELLEFSSRVCTQNIGLRKANAVLTLVIIKANKADLKDIGFMKIAQIMAEGAEDDSIIGNIVNILKNLYQNQVELHVEFQRALGISNEDLKIMIESNLGVVHSKEEVMEINISKEMIKRELIKRGKNVFKKFIEVVEEDMSSECKENVKETEEMEIKEALTESSNKKCVLTNDSFDSYLKVIHFMIQTQNLCCISGPESSGKSFLVNKYLSTRSNFIKIVIDKSIETKSLIGDYIVSHSNDNQQEMDSKTKLSFFEWKDGPLVECIREGKLLVLEQTESGSDELKGFLKGFARSRQVQVRGEVLTIGNGFGLLIIWRTSRNSR
jgi:nicotinamide riboside kinase